MCLRALRLFRLSGCYNSTTRSTIAGACVRQVVESRLFSEGLHVLGAAPSPSQMAQYLSAFFGDELPVEVRAGPIRLSRLPVDLRNKISVLSIPWKRHVLGAAPLASNLG